MDLIASFQDQFIAFAGTVMMSAAALISWVLVRFRKDQEEKGERIKELEKDLGDMRAAHTSLIFRLGVLEAGSHGLPIPFWIKDRNFRFVFINAEYERRYLTVIGSTIATALGKTDEEVFGKETADTWRPADLEVQRTGEVYHSSEEEIVHSDGTTTGLEIMKFPARGHSLGIGGVVIRQWLKRSA